jgi:hypothetical protein
MKREKENRRDKEIQREQKRYGGRKSEIDKYNSRDMEVEREKKIRR